MLKQVQHDSLFLFHEFSYPADLCNAPYAAAFGAAGGSAEEETNNKNKLRKKKGQIWLMIY